MKTVHLLHARAVRAEGVEAVCPRAQDTGRNVESAREDEVRVPGFEREDWTHGLDSSPVLCAGGKATLNLIVRGRVVENVSMLEHVIELECVSRRKTVQKMR